MRRKHARGTPPTPLFSKEGESVLALLESLATPSTLDGMARYGIPSQNALGVSMADMGRLARRLGRSHELAAGLWSTGVYEARMLASMVDEPERVTAAQMDRWCRDFDNWAICDTVCFKLFDRAPHAWSKVAQWSSRRGEFVRRAGFALLWALTVHDKRADDAAFIEGLAMIERAATDERHYVKKAVNMALRAVGKRNATLHAEAARLARRLAESPDPTARWVGKDALRELMSASVESRIERRGAT